MIELRVEGGHRAALALSRIKAVAWDHPGEHELTLIVPSLRRSRPTRLSLGPQWRYGDSAVGPLRAYGEPTLVDGEGAPGD